MPGCWVGGGRQDGGYVIDFPASLKHHPTRIYRFDTLDDFNRHGAPVPRILMTKRQERSDDRHAGSIELPALSRAAVTFVRLHPNQARLAIAAALEAAAAQFEALSVAPQVPNPLHPFVVEAATPIPPRGIIGADDAARRLGVSRATVYNWIDAGRLIGWRLTRQGTYIPGEQILGPGELIPGIEQVLQVISEPRTAWRFLDESSQHFDVPKRPIDVLKAGNLETVIVAARAWGESFT